MRPPKSGSKVVAPPATADPSYPLIFIGISPSRDIAHLDLKKPPVIGRYVNNIGMLNSENKFDEWLKNTLKVQIVTSVPILGSIGKKIVKYKYKSFKSGIQ